MLRFELITNLDGYNNCRVECCLWPISIFQISPATLWTTARCQQHLSSTVGQHRNAGHCWSKWKDIWHRRPSDTIINEYKHIIKYIDDGHISNILNDINDVYGHHMVIYTIIKYQRYVSFIDAWGMMPQIPGIILSPIPGMTSAVEGKAAAKAAAKA